MRTMPRIGCAAPIGSVTCLPMEILLDLIVHTAQSCEISIYVYVRTVLLVRVRTSMTSGPIAIKIITNAETWKARAIAWRSP